MASRAFSLLHCIASWPRIDKVGQRVPALSDLKKRMEQ
jgi:hypothetical protein